MHWLLYGLLVVVPALGIAVQFADGESLPVFGPFDIASPWFRDHDFAEQLAEVHGTFANGLVALAAMHAAAALGHHYVLRDRTLVKMLPGRTVRA